MFNTEMELKEAGLTSGKSNKKSLLVMASSETPSRATDLVPASSGAAPESISMESEEIKELEGEHKVPIQTNKGYDQVLNKLQEASFKLKWQ